MSHNKSLSQETISAAQLTINIHKFLQQAQIKQIGFLYQIYKIKHINYAHNK